MTVAVSTPRAARNSEAASYRSLSRAERYIHITRDAAFLTLLHRHGIDSLDGRRILEIGCGTGSFIHTLAHLDADPSLIEGIDISSEHVHKAYQQHSRVAQADAAALPYADGTFDVALAFTSLSSMLQDATRAAAAVEMLRVLRPGGLATVYDFRLNPTNRTVAPVREREVRQWFSGHRVEIERVTLAPPIVRALGGIDALCRPFERFPFLRTHLLAAIVK